MISRRNALRSTACMIPLAILAGCGTTAAATLDAQVLADATGVVNSLSTLFPAVVAAVPNFIPSAVVTSVNNGLTIAKNLVTTLTTDTPVNMGASTLQTVESYVNSAVNALAAVTPAAAAVFPVLNIFLVPILAVSAILPSIEAFIGLYTENPSVLSGAPLSNMTAAQARIVLHIPTVAK